MHMPSIEVLIEWPVWD